MDGRNQGGTDVAVAPKLQGRGPPKARAAGGVVVLLVLVSLAGCTGSGTDPEPAALTSITLDLLPSRIMLDDGPSMDVVGVCVTINGTGARAEPLGHDLGGTGSATCSFPAPAIVLDQDRPVLVTRPFATAPLEAMGPAFTGDARVGFRLADATATFQLFAGTDARHLGLGILFVSGDLGDAPIVPVAYLDSVLMATSSPVSASRQCPSIGLLPACAPVPSAAPDLFLVDGQRAPVHDDSSNDSVIWNHGRRAVLLDGTGWAGPPLSLPAGEATVAARTAGQVGDATPPETPWWGGPAPGMAWTDGIPDRPDWPDPLLVLPQLGRYDVDYSNASEPGGSISDEIVLDTPYACMASRVDFTFSLDYQVTGVPMDPRRIELTIDDEEGQTIKTGTLTAGQHWTFNHLRSDVDEITPASVSLSESGTGAQLEGTIVYTFFQDAHRLLLDPAWFSCLAGASLESERSPVE